MKILIVGLGVIGGAYAKGLSKKHEVYGIDVSEETVGYALEKGWIMSSGSCKDIIPLVDIIVLAIYPKDILRFISENRMYFVRNQIITDVTGVKGNFIYRIKEYLPLNVEFIGAHPMAGKEKRGILYADVEVFKGANFLITKTEDNTEKGINTLICLIEDLGFGRISIITPEYHDSVIAFTSQLTHAIAVSLVNSDDDPNTPLNIGDSFRDLTRIAKINEDLWSELFIENKCNLLVQMEKFEKVFDDIKQKIVSNDYEGLRNVFIKATNKRMSFDEKN